MGSNNVYAGDVLSGADVENSGSIVIANDSTLNINAGFYGTGAMYINGSSGPTKLEIYALGAGLLETGDLFLSDSLDNSIVGNGSGVQLSNARTVWLASVSDQTFRYF